MKDFTHNFGKYLITTLCLLFAMLFIPITQSAANDTSASSNLMSITAGEQASVYLSSISVTIAATEGEGDKFSEVLCKILCYAKNKFVRFVAIIIIIALGIGLFVGKVNWGVALATILALALIFSSEGLISGVFGSEGDGLGCGNITCS